MKHGFSFYHYHKVEPFMWNRELFSEFDSKASEITALQIKNPDSRSEVTDHHSAHTCSPLVGGA